MKLNLILHFNILLWINKKFWLGYNIKGYCWNVWIVLKVKPQWLTLPMGHCWLVEPPPPATHIMGFFDLRNLFVYTNVETVGRSTHQSLWMIHPPIRPSSHLSLSKRSVKRLNSLYISCCSSQYLPSLLLLVQHPCVALL